jgi:hypothetical protein
VNRRTFITLVATMPLAAAGCSSGKSSSNPVPSTRPSTSPHPSRPATVKPLAWTQGPALPVPVSEIGVALLASKLHVLGGYVGGRAHSTTHQVLDLTTMHWTMGAPLPAALDHVGTAVIGDRLLVVGGYGSSGTATTTL